MAAIRTITADVTEFELLRNSRDGGKRYRVTWDTGTARTKPDAQVAYLISDSALGWYQIDLDSRNQIVGMRKI